MLPVLVAARRELAARVASMSAAVGTFGPSASWTSTLSPFPPRRSEGGAAAFASAAAAPSSAPAAASASAPAAAPASPTLSAAATATAAARPALVVPLRPPLPLQQQQPRPRGRPRVERLWESPQETPPPTAAAAQRSGAAAAAAPAPAPLNNTNNSGAAPAALAALRARLSALGIDGTARDRVLAWTSPDTGYHPALTNPEAVERRAEALSRRLGGRAASRVLSGNPNVLNLQDGRLEEALAVLAEEVGRAAAGELDGEEGEEEGGLVGGGGGEQGAAASGGGVRRTRGRAPAATTATAATTTATTATPAEEAAVSLLTRNHYLLSHARGTLAPRARGALAAVRRVPGCASPPSRAARVLLSQPRLLSSARLAARCDFLAALEATDPHRPAMARRWAGLSPATVGLVLSHRSAALLRLLYLQRAPMRAAAALGASLTSAVTAPAAEFAAAHPGWAAWERALARLPQADVDRCLRELRPPPTLAVGGGGGGGGGQGATAAGEAAAATAGGGPEGGAAGDGGGGPGGGGGGGKKERRVAARERHQ